MAKREFNSENHKTNDAGVCLSMGPRGLLNTPGAVVCINDDYY